MLEIVHVVAVAGGAQIVVRTLGTPEPDTGNAGLRATVADNVRMLHAYLRVVDHD